METEKVNFNREWCGGTSIGCINGCSNNCKYCYQRAGESKNGHINPEDWKNEKMRVEKNRKTYYRKARTRYNAPVMIPPSHDITPYTLLETLKIIKMSLDVGNQVLIVSKPRLDCIKILCSELKDYNKFNIIMRFTICSTNSEVLKFWEPGASTFEERLESLKYAYNQGYRTSISAEPLIDPNVDDLVNQLKPYVTDSIWLGEVNKTSIRQKLSLNGFKNDIETQNKMTEILDWQTNDFWLDTYNRYKNDGQISWKGKLKVLVGLAA